MTRKRPDLRAEYDEHVGPIVDLVEKPLRRAATRARSDAGRTERAVRREAHEAVGATVRVERAIVRGAREHKADLSGGATYEQRRTFLKAAGVATAAVVASEVLHMASAPAPDQIVAGARYEANELKAKIARARAILDPPTRGPGGR